MVPSASLKIGSLPATHEECDSVVRQLPPRNWNHLNNPRKWLKAVFVVGAFLFPALSQACSVCGFGQDKSQGAYVLTAGILTFLPLSLAGSIAIVVWRAVKTSRVSDHDDL